MASSIEGEPLLDNDIHPSTRRTSTVNRFSLTQVGWYCLLLNFLCGLSESLLSAPLLAVYEQSLCITYYDFNSDRTDFRLTNSVVGGARCRITPIQQDLATIRGWKSLFDAIPALLFAIPFGRMADRIGHKNVYVLSLVGSILALCWELTICWYPHQFSLRRVWLSSLFQCIGGGVATSDIMLMAMAADSCAPSDRTQTMYYLYLAFVLAEIAGPVAASRMMRDSLWIPCFVGLALLILSAIVVALVPRARQFTSTANAQSITEQVAYHNQRPNSAEQLSGAGNACAAPTSHTYPVQAGRPSQHMFQRHILLLMPLFFVFTLRYTLLGILVQYSSARFGWDIADSGIFQSEVALVGLFQYTFLVPALMRYLRSKNQESSEDIDLKMANYNISSLFIGSICIGLCSVRWFLIPAVLVFALGFGIRAPILSLLSTRVPESLKGTLFATTTVVANVGQLVCSPVWGYIYAWSSGQHGLWQGTPFYLGAMAFAAAGFCSSQAVVRARD